MDGLGEGFWSGLGAAAAVDWCEPNYLYSPYVAEFWNTLSSLAIVALPAWGIWGWSKTPRREPRFFWGFFTLVVVGLGSAAFHGTLLKYPQASDELPMIYCGLAYAYIIARRNALPNDTAAARRSTWLVWGFVAYGLIVTAAYFSLKAYFHFFLTVYALIVTYLSIASIKVVRREDPRPVMRRLLLASVGCYLGGLFVLWIPEHVLLGCSHPLQALQLHSWFHVTSAVGSYAYVQFMMAYRARVLGESWEWAGVVPYVRVQAAAAH